MFLCHGFLKTTSYPLPYCRGHSTDMGDTFSLGCIWSFPLYLFECFLIGVHESWISINHIWLPCQIHELCRIPSFCFSALYIIFGYSYWHHDLKHTTGAFVGISLEGNFVATRMDTNLSFYGDPYLTTADILLGTVDRPKAAEPLYAALNDLYSGLRC